MAPHGRVECVGAPVVAGNVVNVRVRVDDAFHRQMMRFHILFKLLVFIALTIAGIHDHRLVRVVVQHQRIYLYGIEMKCPNGHILHFLRQIPYEVR